MNNIAQKSLETFAVRVATQLTAAAGGIVIARLLSTTGKGEFTYAGTILALALMATYGHYNAVLWQYGKRGLPPAAIIRVMFRIVIGMSAPLVLAMVLIGSLISSQSSLLFVAAALPFAIFTQSSMGIFLGDGDVRRVNISSTIPPVGAVLVYVPLILFVHRSLSVVLAVWAAGYVIGGIYTMFALRRYRRGAPRRRLQGTCQRTDYLRRPGFPQRAAAIS